MNVLKLLMLPALALVLTSCDESSSGFDINRVDQSVVRIELALRKNTDGKLRRWGHGTGFVIADGIVVTNDHVAVARTQPPEGYTPTLLVPDGGFTAKNLRKATIIWKSKALDLAILRVPGLSRPPLTISEIGPGSGPKKGSSVIAIGFPGAADRAMRGKAMLVSTTTRGVVGKVALAQGPGGKLRNVIQHSAQINPGNSGGPLFNECHHVVGVNTFVARSIFKIVKNNRGQQAAVGAAVVGHFYSPHSQNLITALRTVPALKGISFKTATVNCKVSVGGIPIFVYILIAVFAILAMSAMGIAIFKKGGTREVIKVVESYSQWVRRKGPGTGGQAGGASAGAAAGDATRKPGAATVAPAVTRATGPTEEGAKGWVLSGFDSEGNVVRLSIAEDELASSDGVVIGRSKSQASKILTDGSVSRQHARVTLEGGVLTLSDLGSAYGTTVDGTKLEEGQATPVNSGAKIALGSVTLELSQT